MAEQTAASAPLDSGTFPFRLTLTAKDAGRYLIDGKEHTLSAGETIELSEGARTIGRVSDMPLTITVAG